MIRGVVVLAVVAIGCNAKFKQLPQRSPPAQLAPALDPPTSPPPADHGRIYVDVEDGNSTVGRVTKIEQKEEIRQSASVTMIGTIPIVVPTTVAVDVEHRSIDLLCTSPCWIDLPLGKTHMLAITRVGGRHTDLISLAAKHEPFAYRHGLGTKEDDRSIGSAIGPAIVVAFGVTALVTLPLLALGIDNTPVLLGIGIGGAIAATGGIYWLMATRPVHQDGAGVSYALPTTH